MTNFWVSPLGEKITGNAQDAFVSNFSVIPEGTMALASIKSFSIAEKEATQWKEAERVIQVVYKLVDGDYKNREVTQKIKVFDADPKVVTRALNMLKLVMDLCGYKPNHANEPTDAELATMNGKVLGIVIGEWSMPKQDGGIMDGNFIREVHPSAGFVSQTGVKAEVTHTNTSVQSAFSRNTQVSGVDDDLPF